MNNYNLCKKCNLGLVSINYRTTMFGDGVKTVRLGRICPNCKVGYINKEDAKIEVLA